MTITEFLLARLAEDEQGARDAGADAMTGWRWKHWPEEAYDEIQALVIAASRRMVTDVAAKRAIVGEHPGPDGHGCSYACRNSLCPTLAHLASVYSDHPDYDERWRP